MNDLKDIQQQKLIIEGKVKESRKELSSDLEAIQEKLSPQNLKQEARAQWGEAVEGVKDSVRDTGRRWGTGAADSLKQNPVPPLLVGMGLGLWAYDTYRRARIAPSSIETSQHASSGIREKTAAVRDKGEQWRAEVIDQGQKASRQARQSYLENPLAWAGACLAAGAGIAFALPGTRRENELMGEYRDDLVEKSKAQAARAREVAEQAARETLEVAQREAQQRHVAPTDLRDRAAGTAAEVRSALNAGVRQGRRRVRSGLPEQMTPQPGHADLDPPTQH